MVFTRFLCTIQWYKSTLLFFCSLYFKNKAMSRPELASSLLLPELERQLKEDKSLWPNIKGFFIVTVTKNKKARAKWYVSCLFIYCLFYLMLYSFILYI